MFEKELERSPICKIWLGILIPEPRNLEYYKLQKDWQLWINSWLSNWEWVLSSHMGVSLNGGTPISHPKMIILVGKPMEIVG